MRYPQNVSQPWNSRTSRRIRDLQCGATTILVARTLNICQELRKMMWDMPTIQNRSKPVSPIIQTSRRSDIDKTICTLLHGLNHGLTSSGRIRCTLSRGRPRPFKGGNFMPNYKNGRHGRNRRTFTWKPLQTIRLTGQDALRLRTTICSKSIQSHAKQIGNQLSIVNGISSTNRWNHWKGKSRDQSIFSHLLPCSPRNLEESHTYDGIHPQ